MQCTLRQGLLVYFSSFDTQDVDNDGFADVIFGESPEFSSTAGAAYVIFGSETFSFLDIDVASLDGTNGFKIEGDDAGDFAGTSVAGAGVSMNRGSRISTTSEYNHTHPHTHALTYSFRWILLRFFPLWLAPTRNHILVVNCVSIGRTAVLDTHLLKM